MSVGWGIIGIGRHADARMAPAIVNSRNARLVGVYSRDQRRAEAFAAKHGAPRAYSDLAAFLADPTIEAVYIGSPNDVHCEQTIAALRAGKHVLCDKPLAVTVEQCQRMIDVADECGRLLATGYNNRYQPGHIVVRELILSGEIGEVVFIRSDCANAGLVRHAEWRYRAERGGGSLLNIGIHAADLLRYVTNKEVELVAALDDAVEGGVEELSVSSLRLDGGIFAQMLSSRRLPYPANGLVVHATRGYVRTAGTISYDIAGQVEVTLPNGRRTYEFVPPRPNYDVYVAEIEQISSVILEGGTLLATGYDGLEGVRLTHAIARSAAERRVVRIER
ncbi:MAG: Gfo/Idh/MocA family oxidoreductase [Chloroflexota bacterium]|nr:Gfo/Idh/MocA family oxidoreductase [Dehalococcoidia bacterium]MDW8253648.1 Gfo/Idh/MocA family oxidoreductase [Chloroflexota bacterium]